MTRLTVIGKPDCHLCDVAREVVEVVVAELPDAQAEELVVEELSILDDRDLYDTWWEKIPVVLVDGALVGHWRIAPERLRAALDAAR
ncbi:glutaredoxin family protein [Microbacterium koreense]|uniref:Glutaredoxin family protein n=1 Tax=Microbacterium koreense TaxID=323761 RepID=A0ABW2ZPP1_9MICO